MPELTIILLLFLSGVLAGVCNAVAGGGTFFTFPVFLSAGIPPVVANASNAVAVWPGHALAAVGYRRELREFNHRMKSSIIIAIMGGAFGALLLAYIGNRAFSMLIPFLILFATLLFCFGKSVNSWINDRTASVSIETPGYVTRLFEFVVAAYGGFFGAGLGIMLMGGLLMLGVHDIHANNALKNLLGAIIIATRPMYSSLLRSLRSLLKYVFAALLKPYTGLPSLLPRYMSLIKSLSCVSFETRGLRANLAISVWRIFLIPGLNFLK